MCKHFKNQLNMKGPLKMKGEDIPTNFIASSIVASSDMSAVSRARSHGLFTI